MVRKQDENQTGGRPSVERSKSGQQRDEQKKPEPQTPEQQTRNRVNNHGYGLNQHGQKQPQQQSEGQAAGVQVSTHRDGQGRNQNRPVQAGQGINQGNNPTQTKSGTQGTRNQPERHDGHSREGVQNRGYYRDRNRENDRDAQSRLPAGASSTGGRYGYNPKSRIEETAEDIKEDITRLEKEIELEIQEIKSLKL